MHKLHFHLHINHFGEHPPLALTAAAGFNGYSLRQYWEREKGQPGGSLWIASKKFDSEQEAADEFGLVTPLLQANTEMNGYVEYEVVDDFNVVRLEERPYAWDAPFECPTLLPYVHTFVDAARAADVHVFRSVRTPRDVLDEQLEEAGFYEVESAEERIWTLLVQDAKLAEGIFWRLRSRFERVGGISKIELETVRRLETAPKHFPLRKVVTSGNFLY